VALAITTRLPWSEHPITFNESDQPEHSVDIGCFPSVVSAVLETVRATKIFMDGGSDSNLIYWDTFKRLKIGTDKLHPPKGPITRIVPRRQVMSLGIIDLWVTFSEVVNFHLEILSYEVVDFEDAYHAVLSIPCFVKFMAVPHNAYLKMKMLGPKGIILISRDLGSDVARARLCPHARTGLRGSNASSAASQFLVSTS